MPCEYASAEFCCVCVQKYVYFNVIYVLCVCVRVCVFVCKLQLYILYIAYTYVYMYIQISRHAYVQTRENIPALSFRQVLSPCRNILPLQKGQQKECTYFHDFNAMSFTVCSQQPHS